MNSNFKIIFTIGAVLAVTSGLIGCSGQKIGNADNSGNTSDASSTRLQGSGSTFVKPIMDKWTSEYGKSYPNIKADYQGNGSGAGIKAIQSQTVDFGATDAAMTDDEMKASAELLHIPVILGAVVLTYNVDGLNEPLRLSPEVIADIFLGKIKKWDDVRIKVDNPNAVLPANDITPVYRSDGSGTSDVFTDFLSKLSPEWKEKVGRTKNPQLPQGVGIGAKGNDGVMGQVRQTPNTIGYVELTFARANKLPAALIKNSAGTFIEPNPDTVTSAAAGMLANAPADLRMQLTNSTGADAYPIAGMVYVLVYKEQKDAAKAKELVDFLWWTTHEGQTFAKDLHYSPLPADLVKKVEDKLKMVTAGGKPVRQ